MSTNHPGGGGMRSMMAEEHHHPFGADEWGSKRVIQPIPPSFDSEKRLDYDGRSDDNPVYIGFSLPENATSDERWVIQKLTYDVSDRVERIQVATGAWDNRASLF